jgi:hypothetical protein
MCRQCPLARGVSPQSSRRSVSAPPVLHIDVVVPDPRPVLLLRSSTSGGWAWSFAGPVLLDPIVVSEAASSSRGAPHSESMGLECARFAADRPRRAALRVRTPVPACCVAGWSPPGIRARSELVLAPRPMLARPVSIELIDLPFSHLSHVAVKHRRRLGLRNPTDPPRPTPGQDAAAMIGRHGGP